MDLGGKTVSDDQEGQRVTSGRDFGFWFFFFWFFLSRSPFLATSLVEGRARVVSTHLDAGRDRSGGGDRIHYTAVYGSTWGRKEPVIARMEE